MRLFVALDIPEKTRDALGDLVPRFASICRGARWVRPESVHVTLKFIGHIEDARIAAIQQQLARVNQQSVIPIAFRKFRFFPNEKRPRVFYVGIEASENLSALAAQIETRLEPLGIAKEARAFHPHLTLARFKTNEGLTELQQMISSLPTQDFGASNATEFHLYQSLLKSGGAVYTKLATYNFAKGAVA